MARDTQQVRVLPFPAAPNDASERMGDTLPVWCVRRHAAIGSDAVNVTGYDGQGYPLYDVRCKIGRVERVERDVARWLDEDRAERGMNPLRRTTLPFPRGTQ